LSSFGNYEAVEESQFYRERVEVPQGIYSGWMKKDKDGRDIRHGPGTLVEKTGVWRMEGTFAYDMAFVLDGIKEFVDGSR
jgi:hypothetical protein